MVVSPALLACVPLVGWALGDFFIQKMARAIGAVGALWYICALPALLAPLFAGHMLAVSGSELVALLSLSFVIFVYTLVLFKAFELGKLSVTEAVVSFELPITVGLAVFLFGETLTTQQVLFVLLSCAGIFFVAVKHIDHLRSHKHWVEKGVALAGIGAVLSAVTNVMVGGAADTLDPFFVIWFTHAVLFVVCTAILVLQGTLRGVVRAGGGHRWVFFAAAFFDNMAWFGYAYATSLGSTALTVTISESYIVLAAFLGYAINKESLRWHQQLGAMLTIVSTVLLAYVSV